MAGHSGGGDRSCEAFGLATMMTSLSLRLLVSYNNFHSSVEECSFSTLGNSFSSGYPRDCYLANSRLVLFWHIFRTIVNDEFFFQLEILSPSLIFPSRVCSLVSSHSPCLPIPKVPVLHDPRTNFSFFPYHVLFVS